MLRLFPLIIIVVAVIVWAAYKISVPLYKKMRREETRIRKEISDLEADIDSLEEIVEPHMKWHNKKIK